jgi:small ligand-binding sensory domain FIST
MKKRFQGAIDVGLEVEAFGRLKFQVRDEREYRSAGE